MRLWFAPKDRGLSSKMAGDSSTLPLASVLPILVTAIPRLARPLQTSA